MEMKKLFMLLLFLVAASSVFCQRNNLTIVSHSMVVYQNDKWSDEIKSDVLITIYQKEKYVIVDYMDGDPPLKFKIVRIVGPENTNDGVLTKFWLTDNFVLSYLYRKDGNPYDTFISLDCNGILPSHACYLADSEDVVWF